MKTFFTNILLFFLFLFVCQTVLTAQITLRGCESVGLGPQDFNLAMTGTTNAGGVVRNTYESTPLDFAQSCPAGVCEVRIIWNDGAGRWEIQLDNNGPAGTPDYTTAVLYFSTTASQPNPPDLTLGSWTSGGACTGGISTLSGDVQSSVLPVEFIAFTGREIKNKVELTWQTISEVDNAGFEVERGTDGINFEILDFIEGSGSIETVQDYTYEDKNLRSGQMYYYRLKQIDYDGAFAHSEVLTIRATSGKVIAAFAPNPAVAGQTVLEYSAPTTGEMEIQLLNVSGMALQQRIFTVIEGGNRFVLDVNGFRPGVYLVKLKQGMQVTYEKLLIK